MVKKVGKSSVKLSPQDSVALIAWANEADRKDGNSGFGPTFDRAMDVARRVRKVLDMEGV